MLLQYYCNVTTMFCAVWGARGARATLEERSGATVTSVFERARRRDAASRTTRVRERKREGGTVQYTRARDTGWVDSGGFG